MSQPCYLKWVSPFKFCHDHWPKDCNSNTLSCFVTSDLRPSFLNCEFWSVFAPSWDGSKLILKFWFHLLSCKRKFRKKSQESGSCYFHLLCQLKWHLLWNTIAPQVSFWYFPQIFIVGALQKKDLIPCFENFLVFEPMYFHPVHFYHLTIKK